MQSEGLTDVQLTAHLVLGEWTVLVRGRLYGRGNSDQWDDLLRVHLEAPSGPDDDPLDVLHSILTQLV